MQAEPYRKYAGLILIMGTFAALWGACEIDHGLKPIQTKITGRILFQNPPPPYAAEARVVATRRFPPENLTSDVLFSGKLSFRRDLPASAIDTVHYEIVAEAGEYPAVGVLWRRSGEEWNITNILGIYTDPLQFAPKPVIIDEQHPVVEHVDILADWELAYRDAFVEGDIYFVGEWPENTEILALGMFPIIPKNQIEFLTIKALDITIPLFRSEPYHYRTPVASGTYKFIAVFWKGKGSAIFDIKAIGFHACPTDSLQPREVQVASGETVTGVDIVVDFSTLPGGVRYNKQGGPCPAGQTP